VTLQELAVVDRSQSDQHVVVVDHRGEGGRCRLLLGQESQGLEPQAQADLLVGVDVPVEVDVAALDARNVQSPHVCKKAGNARFHLGDRHGGCRRWCNERRCVVGAVVRVEAGRDLVAGPRDDE
jgi:hypothetical protein